MLEEHRTSSKVMGEVITACVDMANKHHDTWRDKPESYWLAGLTSEVGELASSLMGKHPHAVELELCQIAAIAMNWLHMRGLQGP